MILILPTCIREYWESEIKISWPRRYSSSGFFFALLGQQFSHCVLLTLTFIFLYCQLLESERCSVVSDSSPPSGLIVHRILQARILEWVAFPFSRERGKVLPNPRVEPRSPTLQEILYRLNYQGSPMSLAWRIQIQRSSALAERWNDNRLLKKVGCIGSKVDFSQNILLGGPTNRQIWGLDGVDNRWWFHCLCGL